MPSHTHHARAPSRGASSSGIISKRVNPEKGKQHSLSDKSTRRAGVSAGLQAYRWAPYEADYKFEEAFPGKFGRGGFEDADGFPKKFNDPIMDEVVKLDAAKQYAAEIMNAHLAMKDDDDDQTGGTEKVFNAERNVVKCRIALLNRLIEADNDILCHKIQNPTVKTSVRYRHMVEKNDSHDGTPRLFEVRSPLAWQNNFVWNKMINLKRFGTSPTIVQDLLNDMLIQALSSAVRDDSTKELRDIFRDTVHRSDLDPLEFEHEASFGTGDSLFWQHSEKRTREEHTFTANRNDTYIAVMIGALDVNYCDQWHNPLINKFVQETVIDAAEMMIEDNSVGPITPIGIKIVRGEHVHILELSPFVNPDVCSVQHIFVDAGSGITDLEDMSIKDLDNKLQDDEGELAFAEPRYYHCIGAHRNIRFNEQELNFLHADAFRENNEDTGVEAIRSWELPEPGYENKSKSARISFTGWDVLVTTYHITQHEEPSSEETGEESQEQESNEADTSAQEGPETKEPSENEDQQEMDPNTGTENKPEDRYKTVITLVNYPPFGTKYKKEVYHSQPPQQNNNYRQAQAPQRNFQRQQRPLPRASSITRPLNQDEMFYFAWYTGDNHQKIVNINLIDHSPNRQVTHWWQNQAKRISTLIWENFKDNGWDNSHLRHSLVNNILNNDAVGKNGMTIYQTYKTEYSKLMEGFIRDADKDTLGFQPRDGAYLYAKNLAVWDDLKANMDAGLVDRWIAYTTKRYHDDETQTPMSLHEPLDIHSDNARGGLAGKIALPAVASNRGRDNNSLAVMNHMKERIQSLEHRLQDDRHAGNRDHLLRQLLEKLSVTNHGHQPPKQRRP